MSEIWDIYNDQKQPTGRTVTREQVGQNGLPSGDYHAVTGIWIIGSDGRILITMRHPHKSFGGMWENPGGAVLRYENTVQGAVRELFEETGLRAEPKELTLIESSFGEWAILDSFTVHKDSVLSSLKLQACEAVAARWVTPAQLDKLCEMGGVAEPIANRWMRLKEKIVL